MLLHILWTMIFLVTNQIVRHQFININICICGYENYVGSLRSKSDPEIVRFNLITTTPRFDEMQLWSVTEPTVTFYTSRITCNNGDDSIGAVRM